MNDTPSPDLEGSDSEKIEKMYYYIQELYYEIGSEITGLKTQIDSIKKILNGG